MQNYLLPRLIGQGAKLSRLGGGIGTRGPGETKLEKDRRHIKNRIQHLSSELNELKRKREIYRNKRKKDDILLAAVVGYTNVGKSTLLNRLTGADIYAKDQLFATLDVTTRAFLLPDDRTLYLSDTVGFIRDLPHHLIEAFKSTLEEASYADLILIVCDASCDDIESQKEITKQLLKDLNAEHIPIITVVNKCDLIQNELVFAKKDTIFISAKTGDGIDDLNNAIMEKLPKTHEIMNIELDYKDSSLINKIKENGKIISLDYQEKIKIVASIDKKILYLFKDK